MEAFIRQKGDHAETQRSGFLKIQEIAGYLGIKVSTIYALVERRGIPHYRVGRLVRFKKSEVDQWMEGQRKPAVDIKIEGTRVVASLQRKPSLDVNPIVKKAVADNKKKIYTPPHGKPDQIKGLGKEVKDGTL
jgi:excisionase family DNA binding protein